MPFKAIGMGLEELEFSRYGSELWCKGKFIATAYKGPERISAIIDGQWYTGFRNMFEVFKYYAIRK